MSTYIFDPTGDTLQNNVVGETKTLNLPANHNYLFVVPAFGPYFEESLIVKFTPSVGTPRILTPFVDYTPGFQYVEATKKANRAIYGAINFTDITLVGSVTFSYQALGGDFELTTGNITAIQANEVRDPQFTKWEDVLLARTIAVPVFPTVDHPWSAINVSDIKRATNELEEAGLVVHLRPAFLPAPQDTVYIPSKSEVGLGQVDNFKTATNTEGATGTATNRFMTPASTTAAIQPQVAAYLNSIGYKVPVTYVAGLTVNNVQQTFLYQDNVYAARSQYIPFTTNGSFERDKFILINSNTREHWSTPIVFTVTGSETTALTGAKQFDTAQTFDSRIETKLVLNNVIDLVYKTDYHLDNGVIYIEYPLVTGDKLEFCSRKTASKMPHDRDYYKLFNVTSGANTFTLTDMDYVDPNDLRITLNDFIILSKTTDYSITGNILTVTYTLKLGDVIEVENIDTIPAFGKQQIRELLFDIPNVQNSDNTELVNTVNALAQTTRSLSNTLGYKETAINIGATTQYWRGDKKWTDFATDVRATVLTGLSTATNAVITAADSILTAMGKLQKQISDNLSNLASTAAGKGAALVGFKANSVNAVDRTALAKLQETASVLDFGAKGDGTTDDTVAIQNAINFCIANNVKVLVFPTAIYNLNTSSLLADTVSNLIIEGNGSTLKVVTKAVNNWVFKIINSNNIIVRNLKIYAGCTTPGTVDTDYSLTLYFETCSKVICDNVYVTQALGSGICALNSSNVTINNCFVENINYHPILVQYSDFVNITNNRIIGIGNVGTNTARGGIGILVTRGNDVYISKNKIINTSDTGSKTEGTINSTYENNYVENSGKDGIKIQEYGTSYPGVNGKIINNTVKYINYSRNDGASLIQMFHVLGGVIEGNIIEGGTKSQGTEDGIRITTSSDSIIVQNNVQKGTLLSVSVTITDSSNISISNNKFTDDIATANISGIFNIINNSLLTGNIGPIINTEILNINNNILNAGLISVQPSALSKTIIIENNVIRNLSTGNAISVTNYTGVASTMREAIITGNTIEQVGAIVQPSLIRLSCDKTIYEYAEISNNYSNQYGTSAVLALLYNDTVTVTNKINKMSIGNNEPKYIVYDSDFNCVNKFIGLGLEYYKIPTLGTWEKGTVLNNVNLAVGSPSGWKCTVAGSPGTWGSMGNLT